MAVGKDIAKHSDGVDYAAAGGKDLNNFKGYHNQNENKQDSIVSQHDQATGAHFKFNDICPRIKNIIRQKLQERKI